MTNQPPDDEGNAPEQITETENTENKETEAEPTKKNFYFTEFIEELEKLEQIPKIKLQSRSTPEKTDYKDYFKNLRISSEYKPHHKPYVPPSQIRDPLLGARITPINENYARRQSYAPPRSSYSYSSSGLGFFGCIWGLIKLAFFLFVVLMVISFIVTIFSSGK
jgi:hypothetical protein